MRSPAPLNRRRLLALAAGVPVLGAARAWAGDYLEEGRTARSVTLRAPRTTLGRALHLLSEVAGFTLRAAPGLATEPLVAYIPGRPLRESMTALADLFDGVWQATGAGYQLDPDPKKAKALVDARDAYLRRLQKPLDEQAAEAVRQQRAGMTPLVGSMEQRIRFLLLVWAQAGVDERRKVLAGQSVTFSIGEDAARPIYPLAVALALKDTAPLVGPMLATLDLDDKNDLALPIIRVRATAIRANSVIGAIHSIDVLRTDPAPPPAVKPDGPVLPDTFGENGRLNGTRDDQILLLGEAVGTPILARHRAQGGSAPTLTLGGRTMPQVMGDLAAACDARVVPAARGFQLLRSQTEPFDAAGRLPDLGTFLANRPAKGEFVPFPVLSELGRLTPYQLSILERSNVCSEEARVGRELFTVLRFYLSLGAAQRAALFSPEGLGMAGLTHAQLHVFLDEKRMRGGLEIHGPLQDMRGLRARFSQARVDEDPALSMVLLRDGKELEMPTLITLPQVDVEEVPEARR